MDYTNAIKALRVAAKQADSGLRKEFDSAIALLEKHHVPDKPKVQCDYNHDGQCWGQKGAPECTPHCGYCPLVKT